MNKNYKRLVRIPIDDFLKQIKIVPHESWGYPGKQTMMSGAEHPVVFYLKIKTETIGVGHIVKHSEDGKVADIKFNIG